MPGQPVGYRPQVERSLADPAGQRRAVQVETGTRVDLSLAIQRGVLGVFGDEHMRDRALGRQAALDQPGRRQGLGDALLAGPAGVFRAHRDDHPKLRRHDVQALAPVLADPHHLPAAAGAERTLRLDHLLDPFQVLRQMADIARRPRPLWRALRSRVAGRGLRLHFRTRTLQVLEGQLVLVRRQLLRPLAVNDTLQFAHQMFETAHAFRLYGVPVFQRRVATRQPLDLSVQRAYSRRLFGRQRSEVDLCKGVAASCPGARSTIVRVEARRPWRR